MPKKVSKDKKPHSKTEKTKVPPDAFDEDAGTKVLIAETKEEEVKTDSQKTKKEKASDKEVVKKDVESEKEPVEDEAEKEELFEEEKEGEVEKKEDETEEVRGSDEDQTTEENTEKQESEASHDENENIEEDARPSSFYEKVLGEKPPQRSDDEEEIEEEKEGINRSLFFLGGVVFILTIIIASGVGYFDMQSYQTQQPEQVVEEVPTETPTPTPVEIDREDITFEVLNGSGQSGVAGRTADAIEELGYTADEVGNADSSDYSRILVGFSENVTDEEKEVILQDLKDEFLDATEDEELEPEGTDVLVIVGS